MPVRHILVSTSTGTFPSSGYVDFGDAYVFASFVGPTTANKDYAGTVEGALGGGKWATVLTITTANSTSQVNSTVPSTGTAIALFDKLRLVLTKNNSTHETAVWLAAR